MDLPGVLRDGIDAVVSRGYDTIRDRLLADFDGTRHTITDALTTSLPDLVDAIRDEVRSDVERIVIFTVLLRIQADQARRMDAVDAVLGVFLLAILAAGPLALDKSPPVADRWLAGIGFGMLIVAIGYALFFVGGREGRPTIALQFAGDLRTRRRGGFESVRIALNELNESAGTAVSPESGASGNLARLIELDRSALLVKRRLLTGAAILAVILAAIVGWSDVVHSS
jgi:hypothetical protein